MFKKPKLVSCDPENIIKMAHKADAKTQKPHRENGEIFASSWFCRRHPDTVGG